MSAYNGSGTFVISGVGLPYVTGTTISSTVANQLNTDLATGLSNAICKDGQTTPTANLPMATFKHTGAGNATATGQYLCYGQPQASLAGAVTAAFGTTGTGLLVSAYTQTDSTTAAGTVATAYASTFGAATFTTAVNAITITNSYGAYFTDPVAGTHVTLTNKYAIGADSLKVTGKLTTSYASYFDASVSAPSGTTSTAAIKMMGVGSTWAFTPTITGNIRIIVTGSANNSASGDGAVIQVRYGTGSAPANGDAQTGTQAGRNITMSVAASQLLPFAITAQITGLTVSTAYWFDVGLAAVTGGTANILNLSIQIVEY